MSVFILFGIFLYIDLNKPIQEEINHILTLNEYDMKYLNRDNNYYSYEDDKYYSEFGIDISEHQGEIDFKKVKDAGVKYVILRIGFRGATQGLLYEDTMFKEYYEGAKKEDLKIGIYFFSQAINKQEAIEEAEYVLKLVKDLSFDLPIAFDYEDMPGGSRIDHLNREERTENAIAFLERIKRNNYPCMLYSNMYWLNTFYNLEELSEYDIWFAQYNYYPEYNHHFIIWQYSEEGSIDGIDEPVDLNIMFIKKGS